MVLGHGLDLGAGLEAVRPWLLLAFNGGLLTIAAKLYVDNRRLRLAEKTRSEEFQLEVSADGRNNLQFVIDNLVAELKRQGVAHAECQATVAAQAKKMDELHDENRAQGSKLDGLCRQFIAFSESVGRAIPPGNWSPEIAHMMQQLDLLARAARDNG